MTFLVIGDLSAFYKRTTVNGRVNPGKPKTYNETYLWRDIQGTTIYCKNPGGELAPLSVAGSGRNETYKTKSEQICVDHANKQIQLGNLNGNWTDKKTNHTVIWTYKSIGDSSTLRGTGPGEKLP